MTRKMQMSLWKSFSQKKGALSSCRVKITTGNSQCLFHDELAFPNEFLMRRSPKEKKGLDRKWTLRGSHHNMFKGKWVVSRRVMCLAGGHRDKRVTNCPTGVVAKKMITSQLQRSSERYSSSSRNYVNQPTRLKKQKRKRVLILWEKW